VQTSASTLLFSPTEHIVAWAGRTSLGILGYDSGQTNTFPISGGFGFSGPTFSPDGRELAFAGPTNIMIWDIATRKPRPFAATKNFVFILAFSPNGSLLASAHDGGFVTFWDRASGHEITNILAHPPHASDVAFSPDGKLFASAGSDGTAQLWEMLPNGLKLLHKLRGHVGSVGLFFLPDGRRLVSSSFDNSVKLWDTRTGLEVGTLFGDDGRFVDLARSHDGNRIYSATEDGDVRVWRAPPLDRLEARGSKKPSGSPEPHPTSKNR